jgi:cyanophycinase
MPIRPVLGRGSGPASRKIRVLLYGVLLAAVGVVVTLGANLTILAFASPPGEALKARLSPTGGSLVICGGGGIPEPVRDRFIELAGGARARLVIIPTAHQLADRPGASAVLDPWKDKGVASVQLFHTRSHEAANDDAFVRPLTEATGVWLGGGQQSSLTDAYLGTEVERQLKALLDRGGVIGGTSAGAAVMTKVMIARGRTKPDVSRGFGFLPGAVVDQHFLKRNRLGRLLSVLADHPDLIGLGIDERTALVVNIRDQLLNVMGDSYVVACIPGPEGHPARLEVLKPGDEVNLVKLKELEDPSLAIAHAIDVESL